MDRLLLSDVQGLLPLPPLGKGWCGTKASQRPRSTALLAVRQKHLSCPHAGQRVGPFQRTTQAGGAWGAGRRCLGIRGRDDVTQQGNEVPAETSQPESLQTTLQTS